MTKNNTAGTIVLLNGTSSSGKSAILKEFETINQNYTIVKIDDWFPTELHQKAQDLGWKDCSGVHPWLFLHDYLFKKTGTYYFDVELREKLFDNISACYQSVKDISLAGNNVILDTVLEYEKEHINFTTFFKNDAIIKILVYCPLNILLERVEQRNKSTITEEHRTAFQSFEQFPGIYKIKEYSHETVIDTVNSATIKNALESAIQELITNNIPEAYFPKLKEFQKKFIHLFNMDKQEEIILTPKHTYHLILNSGNNTPKELALELNNFLRDEIYR